jgi:hypothetical protein
MKFKVKKEEVEPRERARLLALALLPQEELVARLWAREMIPDELVHLAIGISDALWQRLKAEGHAPPRAMIGDRRFVLVSDLRDWVKGLQKTTELRRRERKGGGSPAPVNHYQQLHASPHC